MGGLLSSTKSIEEQLGYTLSSLCHLKDCIEGVVKTLELQQTELDLFLQTTENQLHGGELKALDYGIENDTGGKMQQEILSNSEKRLRTLVKENQGNTLEENIHDSIRPFQKGNRTERHLSAAKSHIDKLNDLHQHADMLEKKIEKQSKDISIQTQENENLQKKNRELIEQITNLKRRNAEQLEIKETFHQKETESLDQILQDQENTIVQLFYQIRGDTMSKLVDGLKTLLVNKLEIDRNKIHFIECQREQDVNPGIPLFVLCINTSTLGTDAGFALQKVKGCVSSNVSILIFHHKDVHALPIESSERVLIETNYEQLGGIFDLAFLSDKGIYPCDMNENAARGIVKFLKPKD